MLHKLIMLREAVLAPLQSFAITGDRLVERRKPSDDSRLYALDLARFIAMVFMMQGHVLDALVSAPLLDINTFPWSLWHSIRGFTAPVFLLVSGTVHAFANKRADNGYVYNRVLEKRIRWGITLIGLGYLLTFPANRVWDLATVPEHGWLSALAVNILQLTGAAVLWLVVLMYSTRSVRQLGFRALVAGLAVLAFTPAVHQLCASDGIKHVGLPTWFVAYLTTTTGSIFPFFPFASYLFFGVAIGSYLYYVPNAHRNEHIKRYAWRIGAVLTAVSLAINYAGVVAGVDAIHLDSPVSTVLFMRRIGVAMIVFSFSAWLMKYCGSYKNFLATMGRRSLYVYVIHLVMLFGNPWMDGIARTNFRTMSLWQGSVIAGVVIVCTIGAAWGIDYIMQHVASPSAKRLVTIGTVGVLCWLLLL